MTTTNYATALDQMLFDIFVTALEGGIGYWSVCSEYKPWVDGSDAVATLDLVENYKGFHATITDVEDESEPGYIITRKVVASGFFLATTKFRNEINWSSSKPPLVVGPDTDWDFDAGDADVIVQLGLFGEVIYG